jgi:Pyruvate/2-oxoacid:ferredoxin oxidoreductase delta subunit
MGAFHVSDEFNPLRRFFLFIFARYIEVPLLLLCYRLLRGDLSWLGQRAWFKKIAGVALARPFGYLGDTARPVPFHELLALVDAQDGPLAVGPCRCRMGHRACSHPMETDIVFRTGYHAWTRAFPKEYRRISKGEARAIITACHDAKMFHMVFIHCPVNLYNEYVICNCCACGCVPYIINREFGQLNYPLIDGFFTAGTDGEKCRGCARCVEICPFDARELEGGRSRTLETCFGCGLCAYECPEGAISMKKLREPVLVRDREREVW